MLFEYMQDIYLDSYEKFCEEVDASRQQMKQADNSLLRGKTQIIDLNKVNCLPNGKFETRVQGIHFKCCFHHKRNKALYVFLNGAKEVGTELRYERWSYYPFINGSMLNIADPMFDYYPNLRLGWYYGTPKVNFRMILSELVMKVAELLDVRKRDIVFVGSSGGGASVIECAGYVEGAKAVAINPQIILQEHSYSSPFMQITGNDLIQKDIWNRENAIWHLMNRTDTQYILIVNLRSSADIKQLQNICKAKNIRMKYGLNIFDNLIVWIYDGNLGKRKNPHSVQEYYCIWFLIEHLISNVEDKKRLESDESLYRIINEFWYEHWDQERKWMESVDELRNVFESIHKKKETAIWGTGIKALQLSKEFFQIDKENLFGIQYALDNDVKKRGKDFAGIPIMHPTDIISWKDVYIIIASEYYDKDIRVQLEKLGLKYGVDFISYKDIYK